MNMKFITNIASIVAGLTVLVSYILFCFGVKTIDMGIALQVGLFLKAPFLGVDVSLLTKNIKGVGNDS